MSWKNGKVASRTVAIVGSACFLGGLVMTTERLDAAAYLSLKPTSGTFSGSDTTGYTLTLAAGGATFSYDVVVTITDGAATTGVAATASVKSLLGAVRSTVTGSVTGAHAAYTKTALELVDFDNTDLSGLAGADVPVTFTAAGGFQLDPNQNLRSNQPNPGDFGVKSFGAKYSFLPGSVETTGSGILGVGPQSGTFAQTVESTPSNGRVQLTYGLDDNTGGSVTALRGTVSANGAVGDTASLAWTGGNGSTNVSDAAAYPLLQSWITWTEGTTKFSSGVNFGSAFKNPLSIVFATATPAFVKGDFGGNESSNGSFNSPDEAFNEFDLEGFLLAFSSPSAWLALNPTYTLADLDFIGDYGGNESTNGSFNTPDGVFNEFDLEGFLLAFGSQAAYDAIQPAGPGGRAEIPEPSALGLLLPAVALVGRRRR